jgi:hypothetical protein
MTWIGRNMGTGRVLSVAAVVWRACRGWRAIRFVGLAALLCLAGGVGWAQAQRATATYEMFLLLPDGKPAAGATLRVMGGETEKPSLVADDRGRVKVEGLAVADPAFFLATSADGRKKMFLPVLVVPQGTQRVTVRLYPPGFVVGELLGDKGEPLAGVPVRLSGWEWLGEPELEGSARTDVMGRFEIHGLIAGAYYTVSATEGSEEKPNRTWRSTRFSIVGWDGWHDVGILLPEGRQCPERPPGKTLLKLASGASDEWFDLEARRWRPAVETFDPNRAWAPAPEEAVWIWRAGRPDAMAERYGATVEFRRVFTLPKSRETTIGYLTISADDYAAVRLNGKWVGQTNEYMRSVSMIVPATLLRAGENELRLTVHNVPGMMRDFYNPTGVAYGLELIEVGK